MAQDLIDKRRNLATNTIIQATRLGDAILALQALQAEYGQCGTFLQAEFDGSSLKHVSPALLLAVHGGLGTIDLLSTWYAVNKQNLLQLRS